MADARVALRKLQSGQALTDEEKEILGLSTSAPNPAPVVQGGPMEEAIPLNVKGGGRGTTTDTSQITQAQVTAASIAAAKELAMTPYEELSAAERAAMSSAEKKAYIKAAREEQAAIAAEERAASDPMLNFAVRPDAPPADSNYIYYYSWVGGTGSGSWKLYRAPNTENNQMSYGARSVGGETQATPQSAVGANALAVQPKPIRDKDGNITGWTTEGAESIEGAGTTSTTATTTTTTTTTNASTTSTTATTTKPNVTTDPNAALIASLQSQIASLQSQNTAAANIAAANAAKETESKRQSIIATLTDRFNKYGLSSLVNKIRELAVDGATEATITLALQETPEYQQRFAANAERLKKNLQVLTPAEYLNLEDGYRQVLRAYGLKQFDTDEYVRQFISNDVSAAELSDRVVTAVQRVQNADPAVGKQLRDYYGIGNADLVAYVLDPNQQLPKIQRQVAAAEIGAAAAVQGITAGVSVAEQLASQGVTQAEARKGYATIADILPTAEKLSAIYGGVEAGYGLGEAEQEVFNSLAEAQRKRERLTSREIAAFSGRSGIARTGLTQTTQGQF